MQVQLPVSSQSLLQGAVDKGYNRFWFIQNVDMKYENGTFYIQKFFLKQLRPTAQPITDYVFQLYE